ncbi:hypothetical protein RF55_14944 [Lasius niger]|uniref:Uncharacterized protein n=1 Tax=Lasius niger TaxID=67767 RepID=A0A0J7K723_LASNI|nr:hypothetical protein RF55_14944 [Lasius niger]
MRDLYLLLPRVISKERGKGGLWLFNQNFNATEIIKCFEERLAQFFGKGFDKVKRICLNKFLAKRTDSCIADRLREMIFWRNSKPFRRCDRKVQRNQKRLWRLFFMRKNAMAGHDFQIPNLDINGSGRNHRAVIPDGIRPETD